MARSRSLLALLVAAGCGSSASPGSPDASTPPPDAATPPPDAAPPPPDAAPPPPDAAPPPDATAPPDAAVAPPDAAVVPPAPPLLSACSGTNKVTLFAPAVQGAGSYRVYYGTAPGVTKANGTETSASALPVVITTPTLTDETTYYFVMTAVDASDHESDASNEASATPRARLQDVLFNGTFGAVGVLECLSLRELGMIPNDEAAVVTHDVIVNDVSASGGRTGPGGLYAETTNRRLYLTTYDPTTNSGGRVLVWDDIDTVGREDPPTHTVTGLNYPGGVVADVQRHRLYVADGATSSSFAAIRIYTLPIGDGAVEHAQIRGPSTKLYFPNELYLDQANDRLYVANESSTLVFDGVSTLVGTHDLAPARTVTVSSEHDYGVWVDQDRNLLYINGYASASEPQIERIASASSANGAQTPVILADPSVSIPRNTLQVIDDTLYAVDEGGDHVLAFAGADGLSGSVTPTYVIPTGRTVGYFIVP